MTTKTLSQAAFSIFNAYLHLPFPGRDVSCPYFNNRRIKVRAGLRATIGKGTPQEIVDEAEIYALKEKIALDDLNNNALKRFLVDRNLGIDCSALAYHTLDAESRANRKGPLKKHLSFPYVKNPLRKLLARIRTVENVSVQTLAHEKNSRTIELKNISPGDLIVILDAGLDNSRDHVLLVHRVLYEEHHAHPQLIEYTHSFQWRSNGKYGHGVRQGRIEIVDISKPILEQRWVENEKEGEENETHRYAKRAQEMLVKRLEGI
ncbi:MAG: hypothetical protein A3C90_01705 [Candidatus Magasanikbacteria bacterium RIFCSPHIGHO2_02_FULL_51_14]|uniref:Uncharacterized protein n=1 Tax=Candidatus Magasanikbacteria bacterium RIFCSPHIGHO2_02_FULL_51_14 TaxID=1798683 RepID=A0A1F6MQ32_9BACT|nr:MAG: hypothetical protein A3C90_01705 [Candidatus Magasanikbacteria bacterium RIFCSPHIGHO2_02_FULL_51_14]